MATAGRHTSSVHGSGRLGCPQHLLGKPDEVSCVPSRLLASQLKVSWPLEPCDSALQPSDSASFAASQ